MAKKKKVSAASHTHTRASAPVKKESVKQPEVKRPVEELVIEVEAEVAPPAMVDAVLVVKEAVAVAVAEAEAECHCPCNESVCNQIELGEARQRQMVGKIQEE